MYDVLSPSQIFHNDQISP